MVDLSSFCFQVFYRGELILNLQLRSLPSQVRSRSPSRVLHVSSRVQMWDSSLSPTRSGLEFDLSPSPRTRVIISEYMTRKECEQGIQEETELMGDRSQTINISRANIVTGIIIHHRCRHHHQS